MREGSNGQDVPHREKKTAPHVHTNLRDHSGVAMPSYRDGMKAKARQGQPLQMG